MVKKMENIVVTGGAGFIGSNLVDYLLEYDNYNITIIDNLSTGNVDNIVKSDRVKFINYDLSESNNLEEIVGVADYIYHLAALADIVPSINNPDTYFQSNVIGTFNLLNAIRNNKRIKKFIYAASSSCYGIPENYPTSEDSSIDVRYPYALTKRLGEEMCLHFGNVYNLPIISTRFFNVYGPKSRTNGTYGAMFGVFLAQKIHGKPFTVVGDGNQTRDFTYVTDICSALYKLSLSDITNEIFNVGSGIATSVNDIVNLLGGDGVYIPKRPGEPDITLADISKIKQAINWSPTISISEGVSLLMDNINYWNDAPVWEPDTISIATADWFKYLKD